jgi:hypothetical protein
MPASSSPSHHRQEIERKPTSRSRVGQSYRTVDRMTIVPVVATTATVRRQLFIATAAMTQPAASPEGALTAARVLLHNAPGLDASPEVV